MPPLSDQKHDHDAQRSPKPRKFCFCVTAEAWPVCLIWTTKTAVVAQQIAQRRQSGGRTIAMVAQGLPWWLCRCGWVVTQKNFSLQWRCLRGSAECESCIHYIWILIRTKYEQNNSDKTQCEQYKKLNMNYIWVTKISDTKLYVYNISDKTNSMWISKE